MRIQGKNMEPGFETTIREKKGDLLIVREKPPVRKKTLFLLRGDTFVSRSYEVPLHAFSYFKRAGKCFELHLFVPRLLRGRLEDLARRLRFSDCVRVLDAPPKKLDRYAEIVEAADRLGTDLALRKAERVVNRTACAVISGLWDCFEENDQ